MTQQAIERLAQLLLLQQSAEASVTQSIGMGGDAGFFLSQLGDLEARITDLTAEFEPALSGFARDLLRLREGARRDADRMAADEARMVEAARAEALADAGVEVTPAPASPGATVSTTPTVRPERPASPITDGPGLERALDGIRTSLAEIGRALQRPGVVMLDGEVVGQTLAAAALRDAAGG